MSDAAAEIYDLEQAEEAERILFGSSRDIGSEVRGYLTTIQGEFSLQQLYVDLNLREVTEKANARKILQRAKGSLVEADPVRAGWYRVKASELVQMDLTNLEDTIVDIKMPLGLHTKSAIMPGNIIVVCGGPDSGITSFLLNLVRANVGNCDVRYFNSEMGQLELKKRLDLFGDFPIHHPNFHAYERSRDFADVIFPGNGVINFIDYLEVSEEFYKISKMISDIHRNLNGAVAFIALQTKTGTDLPLGGERALEKARLAISLRAGNRNEPNIARILKLKNRLTEHSMLGKNMPYKLINGSEFRPLAADWR